MIDITRAKIAFKEYVKNYDDTNKKIALKIKHTYKTEEIAKKIAEDLKLGEEDIKLAELIGILHDIGRFEQLKIYDTFSDSKSIDHAELGVKILFQDGVIRNFIEDEKYDNIIYKAIKNHNKYAIEDGLSEKELLHAKIIRDADKTDIYRVSIEEKFLYDYEKISKQTISKNIMESFRNEKQSKRNEFRNDLDNYINVISFIYDYNFLTGLKIIKENQYIEKIMKPIMICEETKSQMQEIVNLANNYIEKRIKSNH